MATPKSRTSRSKRRQRQAGNRWRASGFQKCSECGSTTRGHIACPTCGTYRKRQVLDTDGDF